MGKKKGWIAAAFFLTIAVSLGILSLLPSFQKAWKAAMDSGNAHVPAATTDGLLGCHETANDAYILVKQMTSDERVALLKAVLKNVYLRDLDSIKQRSGNKIARSLFFVIFGALPSLQLYKTLILSNWMFPKQEESIPHTA